MAKIREIPVIVVSAKMGIDDKVNVLLGWSAGLTKMQKWYIIMVSIDTYMEGVN